MQATPEVEGFTIDLKQGWFIRTYESEEMTATTIIPFRSPKGAEMLAAVSAWVEEFHKVVDRL